MHLSHPPGYVEDLEITGRAHWHARKVATTALQWARFAGSLRTTYPDAVPG